MAIDMAVDSSVLNGYFTAIADAIRDKNGETGNYTPTQMAEKISDLNIPTLIPVSGTTGSKTIDTGLSSIELFMLMYPGDIHAILSSIPNLSMIWAFYYDDKISYVRKYGSTLDGGGVAGSGTDVMITISGGTVTFAGDEYGYKLASGIDYKWIAVGTP